jgi:hypothetical protein
MVKLGMGYGIALPTLHTFNEHEWEIVVQL